MTEESTLAFIVGLIGAYLILLFIWWVVQVIGKWKMFTKAGEAGWKSIIPIYSDYIMYKIAWKPLYFFIAMGSAVCGSIINSISSDGQFGFLSIIALVLLLASVVISLVLQYMTAKAYGKGILCTLALIFLTPIAVVYLGFSSAQYVGNQSE